MIKIGNEMSINIQGIKRQLNLFGNHDCFLVVACVIYIEIYHSATCGVR